MAMQQPPWTPLTCRAPPRAATSERSRADGGSRCASSPSNRLAVVGFGILIFFVLFCFVGPLIYHTDQIDTNLITPTCRRRRRTCSAPTARASTSSAG